MREGRAIFIRACYFEAMSRMTVSQDGPGPGAARE